MNYADQHIDNPSPGAILAAGRHSTMPKQELLSVTEAAELLGYDVSTIRRHVGKSLPGKKIGAYWSIKRSDLLAWAETHNDKPGRRKNLGD